MFEASKNDGSSENKPVQIVARVQWGALTPKSTIKMELPAKEVFYNETDTRTCLGKEECISIIQGIQKYNMDIQGMTDIQYHFLIGGDGRIYEGRGWFDGGPSLPKKGRIPAHLAGKYIEIAFIGCFKDREPTEEMKKAGDALIEFGLDNKFLAVDEKYLEEEEKLDDKDKKPLDFNTTEQSPTIDTKLNE